MPSSHEGSLRDRTDQTIDEPGHIVALECECVKSLGFSLSSSLHAFAFRLSLSSPTQKDYPLLSNISAGPLLNAQRSEASSYSLIQASTINQDSTSEKTL